MTARPISFVFDDGGRAAAGHKGQSGDCVVRAIAIATGKPYAEVYAELSVLGWNSWRSYWRDPVDGLYIPGEESRRRERSYIASLGWQWMPTMHIGSGCKVHLRADELPAGRLIVSVSSGRRDRRRDPRHSRLLPRRDALRLRLFPPDDGCRVMSDSP